MPRDTVKAPRSRGCRLCVQRRIKCDQAKPSCQKCKIGNRQCPGYAPIIKFCDESQRVRQRFNKNSAFDPSQREVISTLSWIEPELNASSTHDQDTSSHNSLRGYDSSQDEIPTSDESSVVSFERGKRDSSASSFSSYTSLDPDIWAAIMSPSIEQSQIVDAFVRAISSVYPYQNVLAFRNYGTFLNTVVSERQTSATLDFSLRAISLSYLGLQFRDESLIQASRQQYGKALLQLNHALQTPKDGLAAETLCSTVLLSFYELLNCTAKGSWVRHAGGMSRLMRLRGPECHRHGLGKATFFACRNSLMMEAYVLKIPCFLNEPGWRKLVRDICEEEMQHRPFQTALEEFFAEAVKHPGYYQGARLIQKHNNPYSQLPHAINEGKQLRSSFKAVWIRVLAALKCEGLLATERPSRTGDALFPIMYEFQSVSVGSLYCAYWTSLTILNNLIMDLECHMANCQIQSGIFPSLCLPDMAQIEAEHEEYIKENISNAENTCRSAEDMSSRPFLGSAFLVFALRAALKILKSDDQLDWIRAKLGRTSKNLRVSQFPDFELLTRHKTLDYSLLHKGRKLILQK